MKLFLLHNCYLQSGGEDSAFLAEALMLSSYGEEVIQYTKKNYSLTGVSKFPYAFKAIWSVRTKKSLDTLLVLERPQLAHFHNIFYEISPSGYYSCRNHDIPVVQTLHNYRLICPSAILFRNGQICEECLSSYFSMPGISNACFHASKFATAAISAISVIHRFVRTWEKLVDVYIVLSEFSKNTLISAGLPKNKIVVKPNFVFPDPGFSSQVKKYALFVGRLMPEKGITTLLNAWRKCSTIPLEIIGGGLLEKDIIKFIEKNNSTKIKYRGHLLHQQVLSCIQEANFLVFPSQCYENFPLVIIEAFACGVPVIASRLGAMAEIVEDGKTGLLFTPGDAEDLASKVEWAWNHPAEMAEMGKAARREYEEKYTAERNYQMLMEIYQKAIENHRRQR